jgi:hypothetical protein
MKNQTLKIVKLSALVLVASLAATLPVKSMAHDTVYSTEILVSLLPLLNSHHVHEYGHIHEYERSNHYPHKVKHHKKYYNPRYGYQSHHWGHQPKRIVRSYEGYSDNKIIHKHFK